MLICFDQRTGVGCGAENRDGAQHCASCGQSLRFALALLNPGTIIGGYRISRLIGHGGGGAVYEAEDLRQPGRPVAIKETFDPGGARSFHDEFVVLSQLDHPHLPRYYDLFEAADNGYLVMELVHGQSLQERLEQQAGPLPTAEALDIGAQLCDVLGYLHEQHPPILHRDIKPANVRRMPGGRVKLVDFGLLKQGTQLTRRTIRGMGTPAYAPIEQYGNAGQHTDARSDVYALGATLYHLLTGQEPPAATERVAVTPDPLLPPRSQNPDIPQPLADVLLTAMSLQQRERFADMRAFARALNANLAPPAEPILVVTSAPRASYARAIPATERVYRLELAQTIEGHPEGITALAYSPDGLLLASGSADDTGRVWRVEDGALLYALIGHARGVNGLAWSADGYLIASASADRTLRLWRADDGVTLEELQGHTDWVQSVALSPDGTLFASGSADGVVRFWNSSSGNPYASLPTGSGGVWDAQWSPDGALLAIGCASGDVQIRRSDDGRLLHKLEGHRNVVSAVAWSPDGTLLASAGADRAVGVWRVSDGAALAFLEEHTANVHAVAFAPDGTALASGGLDGTLRLWRVPGGQLLETYDAHPRGVNALVWRPDGRFLATAGMDGRIRLWRALLRDLED